jgi:hypothetical protein
LFVIIMKMKYQKTQIAIILCLVILTACWRVASTNFGLYNLMPMAAIGLFSGSIFSDKRWAYLITIGSMLLSDIIFNVFTHTPGFYGFSQFINYGALLLVTFLGTYLQKKNFKSIMGFTLTGSMIFFLVSNFGTFLTGYYGYSFSGFVNCYTMAIPFYKYEMATHFFVNSILSDLLFSSVAFGIYYLVSVKKPTLVTLKS